MVKGKSYLFYLAVFFIVAGFVIAYFAVYFSVSNQNQEEVLEGAVVCNSEDRDAGFCNEIYQPVCGWFNEDVNCLAYPCASDYSNGCFACMDDKVKFYLEGECPSS